jgi:hypothetical protein
MDKTQAIEHFGSATNLAKALRISLQAVSLWDYTKPIPEGRAWQIEAITGGQLRVDPSVYRKHKEAASAEKEIVALERRLARLKGGAA